MITEAKRSRHSKHYIRRKVVPIDDVFDAMATTGYYQGISVLGKRYQVFMVSGIVCVECEVQAQYFAIERDRATNKFHMNLYAIDDDGCEVLMTRDHIKPRSKGGSDALWNQQTMCYYCNGRKSDHYDPGDIPSV